jgi:phage terminase small subunit
MKPAHELFVANYLKSKNATAAARAAGYSEKSASVQGSRLLKNPYISAAISLGASQSVKKAVVRAELTAKRVMEELSNIALFDPASMYGEDGKMLAVKDMPEATRRAIAGIEQDKDFTKLRISSKIGSLELAAKIFNMVKQQNDQFTPVQIIIAPREIQPARDVSAPALRPVWE